MAGAVADCGDNPGRQGFQPKLDRNSIEIKSIVLLNDLADNQLVSVSNATAADYLTADVADQCRKQAAMTNKRSSS